MLKTGEKLGAFIVPTGVGAAIGGFAGDASGWARKFSQKSKLIVNPNVVNAGVFSGINESMLYVEGYSLDEFFKDNINLEPSSNNKIGVVFDKAIPQDVLNIHLNTIGAVKTVYGIDIIGHEITENDVGVEFFVNENGISTGCVKNVETLLESSEKLLANGAEAIAIVCLFEDPEDSNESYASGCGVDPVGGVEAILSHYISKKLRIPCAHSPAFADFSISTEIVNPKSASEYITPTFLPCVLLGLNNAPKIVVRENPAIRDVSEVLEWPFKKMSRVARLEKSSRQAAKTRLVKSEGISVENLDYLIMPYNSLGSVPVFECMKRGIKIFAVKENKTLLDVTKQKLFDDDIDEVVPKPFPGIIEVETYEDCLKII